MQNPNLTQLHNCLLSLNIQDYVELNNKLLPTLSGEALGEAYLLNAQLKLFTCSQGFLDDMRAADALLNGKTDYSPFFALSHPVSPNIFFLFPLANGALDAFLQALREARSLICQYWGEIGLSMGKQLEGEILYSFGKYDEASAIAEHLFYRYSKEKNYVMAVYAGYTLLRCYLANGNAAHEIIMRIFEFARTQPGASHAQMYKMIRLWLNVTTGWSGDMPRYHRTPSGMEMPALEDRMEAITLGFTELDPTEKALYSLHKNDDMVFSSSRAFYMDVFYALADFQLRRMKESEIAFDGIYKTMRDTGVVMPVVEYGRQIVPLLKHMVDLSNLRGYDAQWLEGLVAMALLYEENLQIFRRD